MKDPTASVCDWWKQNKQVNKYLHVLLECISASDISAVQAVVLANATCCEVLRNKKTMLF